MHEHHSWPVDVVRGPSHLPPGSRCFNHQDREASLLYPITKSIDTEIHLLERKPVCFECHKKYKDADKENEAFRTRQSLVFGLGGLILMGIVAIISKLFQ